MQKEQPYDTTEHYERLASTYDQNWAHSPEYVRWMNGEIADRLQLTQGERVANIGAGTGLFAQKMAEKVGAGRPIVCIDPFQAMLDELPDDPRLRPLCATAEDIASGKVALPYDHVDAIVIKETIHHVKGIPETLRGLAGLMAPGGRLLIVTLPPRLDYPIFQAALERFEAYHPEPDDLERYLRDAGLDAELSYGEFHVTVDRDHYINLVGNKWMSVLSTFSDEEMQAGLREMREQHPEPSLSFTDRFAFVYGRKPS
ncbi:MAG: class I SAM-dependent methyltransferase [Streptosporangiaceae bacterium]